MSKACNKMTALKKIDFQIFGLSESEIEIFTLISEIVITYDSGVFQDYNFEELIQYLTAILRADMKKINY